MRVAIGQAYHLSFDPKLQQEMRPYPPIGALYAAAVVREAGHQVIFHDAMLSSSTREWSDLLDRSAPELAVLYEDSFNYLTKMCLLNMREAACEMIGAARSRGIRSIVCGADATDRADVYHEAGADYVILGEGEATLGQLLANIEQEEADLVAIDGLSIRGKDHTPRRRKPLRLVDELPWPAWDMVDFERYEKIWRDRHGYYSVNLVTTRGCPYHCNWCAKPIWGQTYNARSPESVVAEIEHLKSLVNIDHIWFMDDIFGLSPGWIERFASCLRERGVVIRYKCLSRVDLLLRPGEIQGLVESGCETVWIGAESGSQAILDAMEKGITVPQIKSSNTLLRDAGIRSGFFVQFGYPGEGWPEILQTFRLVSTCQPDDLGVSVSYPLPGTRFYESVKEQLTGKVANWSDSNDLAMLYEGKFSTAFYRRLHAALHRWLNLLRSLRSCVSRGDRPADDRSRSWHFVRFGYHLCRLVPEVAALVVLQFRRHRHRVVMPQHMDRDRSATPSLQE